MGAKAKLRDLRPPLPAPTESMDDGATASGLDTDFGTNLTARTDLSSYEIPEDGSPITISTLKPTGRNKESVSLTSHGRDKSQTSLLIEYFEASKSGDKTRARPSVRVKVTPSSRKRSGNAAPGAHDAVQITGIGQDRKPSYSRRISLTSGRVAEPAPGGVEGSHSSGSTRPPVEIEVLHPDGSDVSTQSRGLMYAPNESNVSSMPPDSLLEGERSRGLGPKEETAALGAAFLGPAAVARDRSASRDRITQKVVEKLAQSSGRSRETTHGRDKSGRDFDDIVASPEKKRRSSKSRSVEEGLAGGDGNLLSDRRSQRSSSDVSKASNNQRLLQIVKDVISENLMPEIASLRAERRDRSQPSLGDVGLQRRVSKSSSTPNMASKPKVVLNRDGDDPGTVLSRGDSERRPRRPSDPEPPSSRRSFGRQTEKLVEGEDDDDTVRPKSSRHSSSHKLRDAEVVGAAAVGGLLTAAALKQHDSRDDGHRSSKKHSKSRSSHGRSIRDDDERTRKDGAYTREDIPPMPMAGRIDDSELTRDSIMSADTERPRSHSSANLHTPVREVSRGSLGGSISPASAKSPLSRSLGISRGNRSVESPRSPVSSGSDKKHLAEIAAAGIGGFAVAKGLDNRHVDADGYGGSATAPRGTGSPAHSVSSLRRAFEEESLVPAELRPRSVASRSSANHLRDQQKSPSNLRSGVPSPKTKLERSRNASRELQGEEEFITPQERMPGPDYLHDGPNDAGTPNRGESIDAWYEQQHQLNDRYRDSLERDASTTNYRDSYQTNPWPQDEKRFGHSSDGSSERPSGEAQDVRGGLSANPQLISTPHGVESAVASLMEPSNVSSNRYSDQSSGSPIAKNAPYGQDMESKLRQLDKDAPLPMYEGSTLSQSMPSQDRWKALSGYARVISASSKDDVSRQLDSPGQSPTRDLQKPVMGASGIPLADDPLPEIGHFDERDEKSDVTTNPSIIQGPLGGEHADKDSWLYSPEPELRALDRRDSRSSEGDQEGASKTAGIAAAAVGGAALLAGAEALKKRQPTVEAESAVQQRTTPDNAQDEGYVTDNRPRSVGARTPRSEPRSYTKKDLDAFQRTVDKSTGQGDDPFAPGQDTKRSRHISTDSHGMTSPLLYDSATGRGKNHIQSKDIVALMDHLTVRDAQRNARDTEILVTLVRSAAEMRQSFDEMKRFIVEQDRMIMDNAERGADTTVQRVLGGPRPQPGHAGVDSPRTMRRQSEEEIMTKRQGVLRRALRGLTGGKSASNLARVEDMLGHILDNVEDLRQQQNPGPASEPPLRQSRTMDSLDSYEKLRGAPDAGYEPEGQAGTSSPSSQSGHFAVPPSRAEKQQFHSGYDGRRGSENRVSTVLEGDEDEELEPHEAHVLDNQFENNERMITPTQESPTGRIFPGTPPRGANYALTGPPQLQTNDLTPRSTDRQRLRKSLSPGVAKVSRWSKTTTSSVAADAAAPGSPAAIPRAQRPLSGAASDSNPSLRQSPNEHYTRSLRSQSSRLTRTPSPLIPSETSSVRRDAETYNDDELAAHNFSPDVTSDDPKYQAHRNSLLLEHPQPRPGPTGRHQNALESRARTYTGDSDGSGDHDERPSNSDLSVSDFDPTLWGSAGTAGLARHRLSQIEPLSPASQRGDEPLVPQSRMQAAVPPQQQPAAPEADMDWEPVYSASGFGRGPPPPQNYYSSPYGSGHLLEPIEEVRYSLETDSGRHLSPSPQLEAARAVDVRTGSVRRITGPRPMTASSSGGGGAGGDGAAAIPSLSPARPRRRPLRSGGAHSPDSLDSETF